MVLEGELTEAEAEVHPHRSILTRSIGVDGNVDVDEIDLDAKPGDRLLLCSDGLTGMLPDPRIAEILRDEPDPNTAVERLIDEANEAGGVDNITALLIDLQEGDPTPRPVSAIGTQAEPRAPAGTGVRSETTDTEARGGPPEPTGSAEEEPPRSPRRSLARARRPLAWAGVTLAILVLVFVGFRVYLDTQWYVGVSDGRVAVFRGMPAEVAGFELHRVVVETTIPAEDATALALYRNLDDGITAHDRAEADAIVERIRDDVALASGLSPEPVP